MVVGFISLGALAERLSRKGIGLVTTSVVGMTLCLATQLLLILEIRIHFFRST
jgi:hypothetical protein